MPDSLTFPCPMPQCSFSTLLCDSHKTPPFCYICEATVPFHEIRLAPCELLDSIPWSHNHMYVHERCLPKAMQRYYIRCLAR